jgi:hypothetical protein
MAAKKKRSAKKSGSRSQGAKAAGATHTSPAKRPRKAKAVGATHASPAPPTPQASAHGAAERRWTKRPSASTAPYLHYVGSRHGVKIWIVDGAYVRKNIDEEFSNFAHHFSIPEVPVDEIWLDREAHPDEQRFFIAHAVVERRAMVEGKTYDAARQLACDAEYHLRERTGDLRRVAPSRSLPQADRVHVRLRKELLDGTAVWIVDGRLVRTVFDIEFTEGGHEYVYEFVPHGQVWIDDDVTDQEVGYVILHELHERNLMAKGMTYDDAHASASKLELHCRRHPHLLHAALADEGWE